MVLVQVAVMTYYVVGSLLCSSCPYARGSYTENISAFSNYVSTVSTIQTGLRLEEQSLPLQCFEIGRSQPRRWIPAACSIPAGEWNNRTTIGSSVEARVAVTASGAAMGNIIQARLADRVEEGVEESHRRLVLAHTSVIQQTDHRTEHRS